MRLLLDTHIWIWKVGDPDKLKRRVADALRDEANELWLSPISIWESAMLVKKGRIELDDDIDSWVSRTLARTTFREAPLTYEVAVAVSKIRFSHRDPAFTVIGVAIDLPFAPAVISLAYRRKYRVCPREDRHRVYPIRLRNIYPSSLPMAGHSSRYSVRCRGQVESACHQR